MIMLPFTQNFCCIIVFQLIVCDFISCILSTYSDAPHLNITHDGPVPLDVPITFVIELLNAPLNTTFLYEFKDDVDPKKKLEISGNKTISVPITYSENVYKPGNYSMRISCYAVKIPFKRIIDTENVTFQLTQYISGELSFSGVTKKYDKLYSATNKVINMTVNLNLPQYVFDISELTYSWTIDRDKFIITSSPYNNYLFQEPGNYNVHVTAVARIPTFNNNNGDMGEIKYKWGYFSQDLESKAPFNAINLTGNTYLKHGQLFNLEVSCNGSGPFEYCWKVLPPSDNATNFTCMSPVITTKCSFPIIYYFHPSGDYRVGIAVDNFVSSMQRKIDVHIYDVSLRPQLSTVIIPLFCSVVVIFIIAGGVMLHVRRNQKFDIEIADFDFFQSDASDVETFWERLYRSLMSLFGKTISDSHLLPHKGEIYASSNSFNSSP